MQGDYALRYAETINFIHYCLRTFAKLLNLLSHGKVEILPPHNVLKPYIQVSLTIAFYIVSVDVHVKCTSEMNVHRNQGV